jgi:hypothetical protein
VYSSHDGAKKCAKELKRLFADSGFIYPLNQCQGVVARAGGFRDWHDLEATLKQSNQTIEPSAFRKRLLEALPYPCRPPALAWLDNDPAETTSAADTRPRWYRDVFPYLMATTALHRSRTALLRPGSGTGQRLRETLVLGLLLNTNGGTRVVPLLEPDTLAFVFKGTPETLFGDQARHPQFDVEIKALIHNGVLDVRDGEVRVLTPDAAAVIARVAGDKVDKADYWAKIGGDGAIRALHDALASIGIQDSRRVADAISRFGSDAYNTPSGPVLDLLTNLAEQGEIETLAKAYTLFATIQPASAHLVRESVPAKISSGYLARYRRLNMTKFLAWADRHPDWPDQLKGSVSKPALFAATVNAMVDSIAAA